MYTKIKTKDGRIEGFRTQQYITGLYLIINDDPAKQMTVTDKTEEQFHKDIREMKDIEIIEQY